MKFLRAGSLAAFLLVLGTQHARAAGDLYFSEYIEGSSNNKAVEIYNGTGASVSLTGYTVQLHFNGSATPGTTITLSGTVASGDVFVLAHGSANPTILAQADQTSGSLTFNGDDAVVLRNNGTLIDVIGQIGLDPGTEWGAGLTGTADNTLRRKDTITAGDTNGSDAFDPALEWDGFAVDTLNGLGLHPGVFTAPDVFIHGVQGSGAASPVVNTQVRVDAIVVGDFQTSSKLRGFFIQEEDAEADADPATSEGIFVFDGGTGPDVSVGDRVRVTGAVQEFNGVTELSGVTVELVSSGHALPSAPAVYLPLESSTELERYEGMRISLPQELTVTENYNLGRFGEIWLSSGGRLMQPTNLTYPGADAAVVQAANNLDRLLMDDGRTAQNPDPIAYPAPGLTASNTLRTGSVVTGATGVVDYSFSTYRIHPTATPLFVAKNPRSAAPARVGGTLKVASFNVLNYFNGNGTGGGFPTSRGATTLTEFNRQRDKIIGAITAMEADIIGLMEIENDGYGATSAIQDLVNGLNNAAPRGTSYAIVNPGLPVIGTDEIAVGLIYRRETVAPVGTAAILDANVDPRFDSTKNRPTLAQTFLELATGEHLTVAVNHLKSKGSACDDVGDPDTGDGQGNCNETRTAAAKALVDWLSTDPTASGDRDFLIIGDMNSYAREDPIIAITGQGYVDLIDAFIGADRAYSYVFDGQSGYLDHALASSDLASQVTGVTEWHINTDEPRVLDYNVEFKTTGQVTSLYSADPYRSSDHDPVLVGLSLSAGGAVKVRGLGQKRAKPLPRAR